MDTTLINFGEQEKSTTEDKNSLENITVKIDRDFKRISSIIPSLKMNTETSIDLIESILEEEKKNNKLGVWNKLDKTHKIKLLEEFADKQPYNPEEISILKTFFIHCLNNNKLQKSKDVNYDKESQQILSIPALCFNRPTQHFTLKMMVKRPSTLKSLTPKRNSIKNVDVEVFR